MLLVRHASAGSSAEWAGDDYDRPLDDKGVEQARELVERLASFRIERILSSPAKRCVDTVEPLARSRNLEVEVLGELDQERMFTEGIALVRDRAHEDIVVCGHGGLEGALRDPPKWKKAAVLVLRGGAGGAELDDRAFA
jgi:phosphohistidine phosphatase SixA